MDKFSELIAKGVAAFHYTPIAPETPTGCLLCRLYNNTFGAATDTHMSPFEDGELIITGHLINSVEKFDRFLFSSVYGGVDFRHTGYYSLSNLMNKNGLAGRYDIVNGDHVYILYDKTKDETPVTPAETYTTESSIIPQNVRFLTSTGLIQDIRECYIGTPSETAARLNESRYVMGNNWEPVYTSTGTKMVCNINNQIYIMQ